jgi:hypothetical protein
MNIFFLDWDPELCAQYHLDKHVVKMILESCQLLYTCHWTTTTTPPEYLASTPNGTGYKPTHPKHPCSIWLRESLDNYLWLVRLARALVDEYKFRYGEEKTHKCEDHLDWLSMVYPAGLESHGLTPPRLAMPDEFKRADPVEAYRAYYRGAKQKLMQYRKRPKPSFLE